MAGTVGGLVPGAEFGSPTGIAVIVPGEYGANTGAGISGGAAAVVCGMLNWLAIAAEAVVMD